MGLCWREFGSWYHFSVRLLHLHSFIFVGDVLRFGTEVKGLGETVAKTAETLNRSESQSEVRTSRVAFCIFLWELNGELKRAIDLSQQFRYFELRAESVRRSPN